MIRARSVVTWPGVSGNVVNVAVDGPSSGLTHDDAVLLQLDHHQASPGGGHHDRRPGNPDVGSLVADTDTAGRGRGRCGRRHRQRRPRPHLVAVLHHRARTVWVVLLGFGEVVQDPAACSGRCRRPPTLRTATRSVNP